ncbi:MAG TPA: bifunctional nuclease family protein [Verrucomicrobiota bacterium]|nr:bifunctional nuclease family protein [Verrucomicrobiota bacterium]
MKKNVVQVEIKSIVPTNAGAAIFVGNDKKSFVIYVEQSMGEIINMFLNNIHKERPLTHDLMLNIFKGFGIEVMHIIISELKNSTYYARLYLKQQNELGTKIVELDARPSDCLAIASGVKCPIFVTASLFEQVEDMSHFLKNPDQS